MTKQTLNNKEKKELDIDAVLNGAMSSVAPNDGVQIGVEALEIGAKKFDKQYPHLMEDLVKELEQNKDTKNAMFENIK